MRGSGRVCVPVVCGALRFHFDRLASKMASERATESVVHELRRAYPPMKTGECPGCLKIKSLVSSHLVSRAVYDYLRTDKLHPIVVGGGEVRATTDQLQAELLCEDCEQILNRGGEQWMVGKLCTFNRQFPLYDILHRQAPIDADTDGETFAASNNPDIDIHSISHFALGVFWKASLQAWQFCQISLGPYGDPIRTWLRGEAGFPKNLALNMILSRPAAAQIIMNPPYETTSTRGCHTYLFHVPGVLFRLSVGRQIPTEEKTLCFYTSAEHFVVVSDMVTKKILHANAQSFNESRKTKSFHKAAEKQKKLRRKP